MPANSRWDLIRRLRVKKPFAGKKQNIQSSDCSPLKSQIITISELNDAGLMEFCSNKLYIKEK